jgi:hypothetical protein
MVDNGQNDREASLFFNPSSYICVGTNMVRVDAPNTAKERRSTNNCTSDEKSEDNAMKFGLLALFQTKEEEDDVEPKTTMATDDVSACCVVVVIDMDGCSFRGAIRACDLIGDYDKKESIVVMDHISQLLLSASLSKSFELQQGREKNMSVTFELVEGGEGVEKSSLALSSPYIQVQLKEAIKIPLEITRFLYRGKLNLDCYDNNYRNENGNEAATRTVSFSNVLGSAINQLYNANKKLKQEVNFLKELSNRWQDTASKLADERARRDNELMENFLVLLNRTKKELKTTRQELMDLKEQQSQQRKRVLNDKNDDANRKSAYTYSQSNRAPQLQPDDILLPNSEDAHEYLNNTELIDRLATGKRIGNDSRIFNYPSYNNNDGCSSNTVVKMECIVDEESGSSCKLQGMQYHSKRRQNPVTRSIELWGSEVIQEELLGRTNNDEGAQIDK